MVFPISMRIFRTGSFLCMETVYFTSSPILRRMLSARQWKRFCESYYLYRPIGWRDREYVHNIYVKYPKHNCHPCHHRSHYDKRYCKHYKHDKHWKKHDKHWKKHDKHWKKHKKHDKHYKHYKKYDKHRHHHDRHHDRD